MTPPLPATMHAVLLTGHGGFDKLAYRDDVPLPVPEPGDVLIRVGAAGVNNTDINTRIGWYSKSVDGATSSGAGGDLNDADPGDSSWGGAPLSFPRIQGADVCGRIVAAAEDVDAARIGERVLVEPCLREPVGWAFDEVRYLGSECDGGFAQYVRVPAAHAYRIDSGLTDVELASFPCSYSTSENMLTRAGLTSGETVLITGASGGVGSASVQLAKRRGARVIAVAGSAKADAVADIGADRVIARGADLVAALGSNAVDVVVDLVAGPQWPQLMDVLKPGGRYTTAGAIAGPIVELDVRTLYLKDLSFFGCTVLEREVFGTLVGYIERGEIRPLVAESFPLPDIVKAQEAFLAKRYIGKLVLVPPA